VVHFNVVELGPGAFGWTTKRASTCLAVDGSKHEKLAEERFCAALRASGIDCYAEPHFLEVAAGKMVINLMNAPSKSREQG
jgi:hypothetical protein